MSDHYREHPSGIEPWDIVRHETFTRGNVIKYVMRAPYKGDELGDLFKALDYLVEEIEQVIEMNELAEQTPKVLRNLPTRIGI